ncbi:MAG: UDP-N-acetylmuramoyl-L-alanyl-D-glutamate--2,6-diaminopimelate ligase [Bacillota bacterium]
MNLKRLIGNLDACEILGSLDGLDIAGIKYDSRLVLPGDLLVCIPGFKTDGHLFAGQAVDVGASCLVVERFIDGLKIPQIKVPDTREALAILADEFYEKPSMQLGLIGVTGTNGKTTTTYLIKALLESKTKVGLVGTIGNIIGHEILPSARTTPESVDLQKLLREMVDTGVKYSVMEVSSHALELKRVNQCAFDIAVYTNLSQDHLDFHDSLIAYRNAKGILFELVGSKPKDRPAYAVINRDDKFYEFFRQKSGVPVFSYGVNHECDYKAANIQVKGEGVSFEVYYPKGKISLSLKMTGLFNIYNSLAAFAVGHQENIPPETIKSCLENVEGVPGRFEKVNAGQDFTVIVDYAHTPDSLVNVLKSAKGFVKGRVITVFGCGGDRDRTKRPLMGEAVAMYSDFSIVTSDNPRSESPESIIEDILPGMKDHTSSYEVIPDRRQAIGRAIELAKPNDLILIAGKGHETYQEIKGKTYPFDDRVVAREYLEKMLWKQS